MRDWHYILVIFLISSVDFITLVRTRIRKPEKRPYPTPRSDDFNILIPIFGNISYLKNVEYLKEYGSKVILCTTTKETDEFNEAIGKIIKKYKFRIYRSDVPLASAKNNPNPWNLFSNTLEASKRAGFNRDIARDEIMRESTGMVTSSYCVFLDGDTYTRERLEILVGLFRDNKFDAASVRVLASRQETVMEKLQAIEYELAMDARRIYPWLTSGAGMIARTSVIREIMKNHSLFFSGGDIEIGKLAEIMGFKVGHISFDFFTDVPPTFSSWFNQRLVWFGGGFRHAIVNFYAYAWDSPLYFLYNTIIVYLLVPFRIYEVVVHPWVIPLVFLIYTSLLFSFRWQQRSRYYLLFPLYALTQVFVLVPLGIYYYFRLAVHSDNVGFIKLKEEAVVGKEQNSTILSGSILRQAI